MSSAYTYICTAVQTNLMQRDRLHYQGSCLSMHHSEMCTDISSEIINSHLHVKIFGHSDTDDVQAPDLSCNGNQSHNAARHNPSIKCLATTCNPQHSMLFILNIAYGLVKANTHAFPKQQYTQNSLSVLLSNSTIKQNVADTSPLCRHAFRICDLAL